MQYLKVFFVYMEIAFVVGIASYFVIEGFPKNTVLTAILLFLGASSLFNLVGYFSSRGNKHKE